MSRTRKRSKRARGRPPKPELATPIPPTKNAVPPTDETVAKNIPDVIRDLAQDLQEAAASINRAYFRLCARLMSRAAPVELAAGGKQGEYSARDVVLILRYQAWMRQATKLRLNTECLIDMICDGIRPEVCDRRLYRRPGTNLALLVRGLELYVETRIPLDARGRNVEARLAETGDSLRGRAA